MSKGELKFASIECGELFAQLLLATTIVTGMSMMLRWFVVSLDAKNLVYRTILCNLL